MGHAIHIQYNDVFMNSIYQRVLQKTEVDPLGNQTITTLDAHGHVSSIIRKNAMGVLLSETTLNYDASGNKIRQTDAVICPEYYPRPSPGVCPPWYNRQMVTAWFYGPMNRLEKEVEAFKDPLQRETRFTYDAAGKLQEKITPGGARLIHEYDAQGRLAAFYSLDSSAPINYRYQYDRNHRVTEITDMIQGQTIRRNYDPQGNLVKEVLANRLSIESNYDPVGRRTALAIPQTGTIQYTYDAAHLQSVVLLSSSGQKRYVHTYTKRDLRGLPWKQRLPQGWFITNGML